MNHKKDLFAGVLTLAVSIFLSGEASAAGPQRPEPKVVSCKPVRTPAQLQAMTNDLTARYCLANDLDLSSIANFIPVGTDATPFTGHFFGNNHVIRNLQ